MNDIAEKIECRNRERWLVERANGIGGSEAAAAIGVSPWMSQLELWGVKCGLVDPPDIGGKEFVKWGKILEEPIAGAYCEATKRELHDPGEFTIYRNPERTWQFCTPDRLILLNGLPKSLPEYARGFGVLSIKNAGEYRLSAWEEEPPLEYQVQFQHELEVTGAVWGSFAVLVGGNKFFWCDAERNQRFINWLVEGEERFMDYVRREEPPPADASDSCAEVLKKLYPRPTADAVELHPDFIDLAARRQELKEDEKQTREFLKEIDNKIKLAIGEAEFGVLPDGSGFSWKAQHRDTYTVEASDYRTLRRVKKIKAKGGK